MCVSKRGREVTDWGEGALSKKLVCLSLCVLSPRNCCYGLGGHEVENSRSCSDVYR